MLVGQYQWTSTGLTVGGQLTTTASTGTAALVVSSTTPIPNLNSSPVMYTTSGTQWANAHVVFFSKALSSGAATITFSGPAVFTNNNSYACIGNDANNVDAVKITNASGTQFNITGTASDFVQGTCIGY